MSLVTWLHLSDFHFNTDNYKRWDASKVLRSLLQDIQDLIKKNIKPDFIIVTGDIAFSGKKEEYDCAANFFTELLNKTNIPNELLFIVPGNHDVDWRNINDIDDTLLNEVKKKPETIVKLLTNKGYKDLIFKKFENYRYFIKNLFPSNMSFIENNYYYKKNITLKNKIRIQLLGLNSAWTCPKGNSNSYGNLVLGEYQVRSLLETPDYENDFDPELIISFMHHPFDYFIEFDKNDCKPVLLNKCQFILHGHNHQSGMSLQTDPDENTVIIAAGAAYAKDENAYNVVSLDFAHNNGKIFLRRYSPNQGGFWTSDAMIYKNVPSGIFEFDTTRLLKKKI